MNFLDIDIYTIVGGLIVFELLRRLFDNQKTPVKMMIINIIGATIFILLFQWIVKLIFY